MYPVEEFSVQTCSKCLEWMPDELFTARIVQNKTFSLKRDLITFQSDTFDIKNPRTSEVNPWFLIYLRFWDVWSITLLQVYSHQQTDQEKDEFLGGLETYFRDPGDVVLLVSCCQAARACCSRIQTTTLSHQVIHTINSLLGNDSPVSPTLTIKWSQNINSLPREAEKIIPVPEIHIHKPHHDQHHLSCWWSVQSMFTAASSDLLDLFVYWRSPSPGPAPPPGTAGSAGRRRPGPARWRRGTVPPTSTSSPTGPVTGSAVRVSSTETHYTDQSSAPVPSH